MRWKYYIPHIWNQATTLWEDVYLLPDVEPKPPRSIWLTVDAVGTPEDGIEEYERKRGELGDRDFLISDSDRTNMLVRGDSFTKEKLLHWASIWLKDSGFPVTELIEGSAQDFAGTNSHAEIVAALKDSIGETNEELNPSS